MDREGADVPGQPRAFLNYLPIVVSDMAIVEISIVLVGTGNPSFSQHIAWVMRVFGYQRPAGQACEYRRQIEFTASWCDSCFSTCMAASGLAAEYDQRVKFVRCTEVAKRYGIGVLSINMAFIRRLLNLKSGVKWQKSKDLPPRPLRGQ